MPYNVANPGIVFYDVANGIAQLRQVDRLLAQHAFDRMGVVHDRCQGLGELMRKGRGQLAHRLDAGEMNQGFLLALDLHLQRHPVADIDQRSADARYAAFLIDLRTAPAAQRARRLAILGGQADGDIERRAGLAPGGDGTAQSCQIVGVCQGRDLGRIARRRRIKPQNLPGLIGEPKHAGFGIPAPQSDPGGPDGVSKLAFGFRQKIFQLAAADAVSGNRQDQDKLYAKDQGRRQQAMIAGELEDPLLDICSSQAQGGGCQHETDQGG